MTIERLATFSAEDRVRSNMSLPMTVSLPDIATDRVYTGTYSYGMNANPIQFGVAVPVALSAYRYGCFLYNNGIDLTVNARGMLYRASNGIDLPWESPNIAVRLNMSLGTMEVVRPLGDGSANYEVLASVPVPAQFVLPAMWMHVGVTHKIHASTGFLSVYIDGNRVLNYVGDTRLRDRASNFGATAIFVWGVGNEGAGFGGFASGSRIDDYFIDSYEGEADVPVPARRFLMALPNGAGADADWTPVGSASNYQNVDDNPYDGDATYNKALAANLRDTFVFGDITLPQDHVIRAVIVQSYARRLDTETLHRLSLHAHDGANYQDSADLDLRMAYNIPVFARYTTQPDGSPWNEADFNAMQFGYRSRGDF